MPLYDGVQNTWIEEEIDMTDFLGESIQLRFQLVSDNFVTGDGFYFDDFKIYIGGSMDSVINNVSDLHGLVQFATIVPNPAQHAIRIDITQPWTGQLLILNTLGQEVMSHSLNSESQQTYFDVGHLPAGSYYVHLLNADQLTIVLPLWIQ
jgi:hypothetical protein